MYPRGSFQKKYYEKPASGWVCFHCGELFKTFGAAQDHFGDRPEDMAACRIKNNSERGLVIELRKAQRMLREFGEAIAVIASNIDNEGDRCYFGSTNDADWLKDLADKWNTRLQERGEKATPLED